jgi:ribosomal protein L37AE/L43A
MMNTASDPLSLPFHRAAADVSDTRVEPDECDRCGRTVSRQTAIDRGEGVLVCPECETSDA